MNSTPNSNASGPDAVLVARADERLVHAYEQIARADEQLARVTEQLSKLEQDAARQPPDDQGRRLSRGWPLLRGFIGLSLAAGICAAAFALQTSYGEAAKLTIARWAPYLISMSSLRLEKPEASAQASQAAVQTASAEAAPSAQGAAQDVASTAAPLSPELAQLLQTMAHDLATVEQGIEQLKASQERMASDNARAVEQLRASQEELTRLVARASEQDQRAKTAALPPPRPVATPARKPPPTHPSSQARAQPQPIQLQPDEQ
jgi:hypothetical protein